MGGNEEAERANDGDDEEDVPERAVPVEVYHSGYSDDNFLRIFRGHISSEYPDGYISSEYSDDKVSRNIPTAKVRRNTPIPLFSRNVSEDRSIGNIRGDTDEQS
ncbi:hypothetical protein F2Q69_00049133 [Brassica cretica]|uniref:Uncharacterized protein n=1 Tax=Brassica cretica TaxID=69181 RepID=A0A8S9PL55_BRACR|nr:hypothetical protein F2Q69_00049133 [Brassica cretica]